MLSLLFVVVSPCIVFVQSTVSRFTLAILFMAIFLYDQCSAQIYFQFTSEQTKHLEKKVFSTFTTAHFAFSCLARGFWSIL